MEKNIKTWIWLSSVPGLGASRFRELIRVFKTPSGVWDAVHSDTCIPIEKTLYEIMLSDEHKKNVESYMNKISVYNIDAICLDESRYPENLANIYDPPAVLYTRGFIMPCDSMAVALVGSRRASAYGIKVAEQLAYELSIRGITIISGMARGIDAAAHKGALRGGGRTIAVLGCGVDTVYPPEHKELMNQILGSGAVVSEYTPGTHPSPANFPARNRIISGLALGVVVVEAAIKSGSLITSDFALEQGRDVFAVPGNITNHNSTGTNKLIRQGACLVSEVQDIIDELGLELHAMQSLNGNNSITINPGSTVHQSLALSGLGEDEKKVLKSLSLTPIHLNDIAKLSGLTVGTVSFILTILEIQGFVKQLSGKLFVKA